MNTIPQETQENQTVINQMKVQQKVKLDKVRWALIEVLAENWNGISLAQLPIYLKNKLDF